MTAFTPAISLAYGLDTALGMVLEEGLEAAFDRHVRLGRACTRRGQGDGLGLLPPRTSPRGRYRDPDAGGRRRQPR